MEVDISIVSRTSEPWFQTPAAVYIMHGEELHRLGARSLPEALRFFPTLNVAQVDAHQWAISARGFNGTTSNKLLVLIDGRSVYTPLYSGVFWDVQDVSMVDIDRIEVICGPGGTLWGANAVNGIINVITKNALATADIPMSVMVGTGNRESMNGTVRWGRLIDDQTAFRLYAKRVAKEATQLDAGGSAQDAFVGSQAGFRIDAAADVHSFLLQSDIYSMAANQPLNGDLNMKGGNIGGQWKWTVSEKSQLDISSYFDYSHRRIPGTFGEDLGIIDLNAQYTTHIGGSHTLLLGSRYRYANDRVVNSVALAFLPPRLHMRRYSLFVEDMISLSEVLSLTLGSKVGHNDFSGFEYEPRMRLRWNMSASQLFWLAISRAVRTPSRIDRDLYAPGTPPYTFLGGGPEFKAEQLLAYEAGYRFHERAGLYVDFALFYNDYTGLRSFEPESRPVLKNGLDGITYGVEVMVNSEIAQWWRLRVGYSHLQKHISLRSWSRDISGGLSEGNDARHQLQLHSFMSPYQDLTLDAFLYFVDRLPNSNAPIPPRSDLDVRAELKISPRVSCSVLVRNVFHARRVEFGSPSTRKIVEREVYGSIEFSI